MQGRRAPGHVVHGVKYFDGGLERPQVLRVTLAGQTEDKAVLKRLQGKALHIARVGGHVAVEIVGEIPHAVQVHPGAHAITQQPGLVLHAHIPQALHRVVGADRLLDDGRLLRRQGPHPGLHPLQQGFVQGKVPRRPQEQGILHPHPAHVIPAYNIVKGLQQQEQGGALIGLHPGPVRRRDHGQGAVPVQLFVQLTQLAVPVDQQNVVGIVPLHLVRDGLKGRSDGIVPSRLAHGHMKHLVTLHGHILLRAAFPPPVYLICLRWV